jgi:hypothetical protein
MNKKADLLYKQINELLLCIKQLKEAYLLCNTVSVYLEKDFNYETMLYSEYEFGDAICIEPQILIYKQQINLQKILEKKQKQYLNLKK